MKIETLQEKGLSRIQRHADRHAIGSITAFRGDKTHSENTGNNKKILAYLLNKGYSVTKIKGSYIENMGSEDEREVGENSFFVVNINVDGDDEGQLEKDLIFLGQKFDQDSILSKPFDQKARLIGTSDRDNAFPAKGETMEFDKMKFGDTQGQFFSRTNGRKFAFESLGEIGYPITNFGIRAMQKLAESIA